MILSGGRESARGMLAKVAQIGFNTAMDAKLAAKYANHPLVQALLRKVLAIQDRFSAEPIYAKTGKGLLKSAGVEEINGGKSACTEEVLEVIHERRTTSMAGCDDVGSGRLSECLAVCREECPAQTHLRRLRTDKEALGVRALSTDDVV